MERGCWLPPRRVGCCGQRPGRSTQQERCREGAGFHFPAHESAPCAAAAGAAAGARGPSRPCGPVGGWREQGAVPPCLHPKLPGSVAGEPAVVRAWLCPLHRAGSNFAVGPNSLRRSPPTEILLQIWEQSVAVSFPSHEPDTQFAVAGGDPRVWG